MPERAGERVLVFVAGGERFACRLGSVREILPMPAVTPLPGAPRYVVGVVHVRGRVVTVLDGVERWTPGGSPASAGGTLLVLAFDGRWLGVRVDDVDGVAELDTAHVAGRGAELFEISGRDDRPLRLVDVAILLQQVLRDRGEMNP